MRVATEEDIPEIERIVNHPSIIEGVTNDATVTPIRAAEWLERRNFVLLDQDCCFVAINMGPYRYQIHTNILPCTGHRKLRLANAALRYAFIEMPVAELLTMVPESNPAAWKFAQWLAFRPRFERKHAWPKNGGWERLDFLSLNLEQWIESGACVAEGIWFHERLKALGGAVDHGEDWTHDCYVGACMEMVRAGHPDRAVAVYNHWARFARYEEVTLVSLDPVVIDIASHRLKLIDGEFFLGD